VAGLLVASGVFHLGVLLVTHGSWYGPVSWRKPMTFGLSFGLTLATITWVASFIPFRIRSRASLLGSFAVACVLEVALITLQAWRHAPSHFNLSTAFNGVVSRTLALGGAVLIAVITILTVAAFRTLPTTPPMRAAIRTGLVALDIAMLSGAAMIVIGMRRVFGGDQAGAYVANPALKLLHGVTMHAILVLPVLALLLGRSTWSQRRQSG
jgi:hypothetical protein